MSAPSLSTLKLSPSSRSSNWGKWCPRKTIGKFHAISLSNIKFSLSVFYFRISFCCVSIIYMFLRVIKFLIATGKALMILNRDLLVFSWFIDSLKTGRAPESAGKRGRPNALAWSTNWKSSAREIEPSRPSCSSWEPKSRRRMLRTTQIPNRTNLPEILRNNLPA